MNPLGLDNDVIGLGYRRKEYFHLVCTQAGLGKIPKPFKVSKPDSNGYMDVYIAATEPNVIGLLIGGWITRGDANRVLKG